VAPADEPDFLDALSDPASYPHSCDRIERVETHISWLFLTGECVYKLKKPVAFGFVDFSTAARREHFCREELRCNRAFAPDLYLDVVAVQRDAAGRIRVGPPSSDATVLEWAVQMRQFDRRQELDRLLEADALEAPVMRRFGESLAGLHAGLPVTRDGDVAERVQQPVLDNFSVLAEQPLPAPLGDRLEELREASIRAFEVHQERFVERLAEGFTRECHGDLHLGNLVLTDAGVVAFDCLEFNANLRWIDVQSDAAFLHMDCAVRGRPDLASAFYDGYLEASADYAGSLLLAYYSAYRAMVRAKVTALELATLTHDAQQTEELEQRLERYLDYAWARLLPKPGVLVILCGVSGSGKSYLATDLVPVLAAIRLRSDVARKALAGLAPRQRSGSGIDSGLYAAERTDAVYGLLEELGGALAAQGGTVIVDATCLRREQRGGLIQAARAVGAEARILYCTAPRAVLEERVRRRSRSGDDPSEADMAVLERQFERLQVPDAAEAPLLRIDTAESVDMDALRAWLQGT